MQYLVSVKEHLAGVRMGNAPDLDAALRLATAASRVRDPKTEVRPFP